MRDEALSRHDAGHAPHTSKGNVHAKVERFTARHPKTTNIDKRRLAIQLQECLSVRT